MALSEIGDGLLLIASAYKCMTRKEGFYAKTLDKVAGSWRDKELWRALSATGLLTNMRRTLVSHSKEGKPVECIDNEETNFASSDRCQSFRFGGSCSQ